MVAGFDMKQRIELSDLPKVLPDFRRSGLSRDLMIEQWLGGWIEKSLDNGVIMPGQLLPRKSELAFHLSVSTGTIQSAIRYLEDKGVVISKQRVGTLVAEPGMTLSPMRKLKSKREKIVEKIKTFMVTNGYKPGDSLPSSRQLAMSLGSSANTTRLALEYLFTQGVIQSKPIKGNETYWSVKELPDVIADKPVLASEEEVKADTLVEQVEQELKNYISKNHKPGDKLGAHNELAKRFNVSIKTIHDALKLLVEQGVLLSRRGRYGTTVLKMPSKAVFEPTVESSIFDGPTGVAFYSYQKVENNIKLMIKNDYDIGYKLPSMEELAGRFNVSTNTIRKALHNLEKQDIITFARGRYGGTFVANLPEQDDSSSQAFKWLAVSPEYLKVYHQESLS